MSEHQNKPIPRKKSASWRFIGAVLWAFFLGFLFLLMLNLYEWHREGFNPMMQNLSVHYASEVDILMQKNVVIGAYSVAALQLLNAKVIGSKPASEDTAQGDESSVGNTVGQAVKEKHGFIPFVSNHVQQNNQQNSRSASLFSGIFVDGLSTLAQIGAMLWASFLVLLFKFINIMGATLIYVLAALLGACDGLVTRYVRTAEGGRESTFIFHKMTDTILQIPAWLIMIYLVSPVLINPTFMIGLLALSFFMVFNIATANLKKFL